MTELLRRIDVALDALVDVDRATDGDLELDAWVSQSRLALLAAADAARRAEADERFEQLELEALDAELDELADRLELERYGDEAAA